MDLDESILQNQYILDNMEPNNVNYIYCIIKDNSSFLFTSDLFSDVKFEYMVINELSAHDYSCTENYSLVKINSNYFDPTNFEQSYKYFEEI